MLTFNVFISYLENGMEYTLGKFTYDTKLGRGMTDELEVWADTQRHFNRLEKRTDGDRLKFNRVRCRALRLEGTSLMQQVHWGLIG